MVSEDQQRGSLFVPIHWSDETASSRASATWSRARSIPIPASPRPRPRPQRSPRSAIAYRGFALGLSREALPDDTWWSAVTVKNGVGLLLASNASIDAWRAQFRKAVGEVELAEYRDEFRGIYRVAAYGDGRLGVCVFLGPSEPASAWDQVKTLFEAGVLDIAQRQALLSGRSASGVRSAGPTVCACFSVGLNTIRDKIESGEATTVDEIGKLLRAGTNCGSCLPELKRIIATTSAPQTA